MYNIHAKKVGDWRRVGRVYNNLNRILHSSTEIWARRVGLEGLKIVKGHIKNQDLNWSPLSARWVAYKKSKSVRGAYANKIWYFRGNFMRSLGYEIQRVPNRSGTPIVNAVFIGVMGSPIGYSGKSVSDYARYNEYSVKTPSGTVGRPLFTPSTKELKNAIQTKEWLQPHVIYHRQIQAYANARGYF